MKKIRLLLILQ